VEIWKHDVEWFLIKTKAIRENLKYKELNDNEKLLIHENTCRIQANILIKVSLSKKRIINKLRIQLMKENRKNLTWRNKSAIKISKRKVL
jgi:hypothetical protein